MFTSLIPSRNDASSYEHNDPVFFLFSLLLYSHLISICAGVLKKKGDPVFFCISFINFCIDLHSCIINKVSWEPWVFGTERRSCCDSSTGRFCHAGHLAACTGYSGELFRHITFSSFPWTKVCPSLYKNNTLIHFFILVILFPPTEYLFVQVQCKDSQLWYLCCSVHCT